MADPPLTNSPISQVLSGLGLTREDLLRHSDQMRQFLTAEEAHSLRVFATDHYRAPLERSASATSLSRSSSKASVGRESPKTPIKGEPSDVPVPPTARQVGSMEAVMERKSRQKRNKKNRSGKDTCLQEQSELCGPLSPNESRFSMDVFMESRDSGRVDEPGPSESSRNQASQVDERVFACHSYSHIYAVEFHKGDTLYTPTKKVL
jgi:hypothetical protein